LHGLIDHLIVPAQIHLDQSPPFDRGHAFPFVLFVGDGLSDEHAFALEVVEHLNGDENNYKRCASIWNH